MFLSWVGTELLYPARDFNEVVFQWLQLLSVVRRVNPFLGGDGRAVGHICG